MRISDWSSDVCSSDLATVLAGPPSSRRSNPSIGSGRVWVTITRGRSGGKSNASSASLAVNDRSIGTRGARKRPGSITRVTEGSPPASAQEDGVEGKGVDDRVGIRGCGTLYTQKKHI